MSAFGEALTLPPRSPAPRGCCPGECAGRGARCTATRCSSAAEMVDRTKHRRTHRKAEQISREAECSTTFFALLSGLRTAGGRAATAAAAGQLTVHRSGGTKETHPECNGTVRGCYTAARLTLACANATACASTHEQHIKSPPTWQPEHTPTQPYREPSEVHLQPRRVRLSPVEREVRASRLIGDVLVAAVWLHVTYVARWGTFRRRAACCSSS